jgi:PAS domain S-box-containing protein
MPNLDYRKLVHELEVHQLELDMQNKELQRSSAAEQLISEKYANLYDFAPTGYFSLSDDARIQRLNFAFAKILGQDRSALINQNFRHYISIDSLPIFDSFMQLVFESKTKQTCEIILKEKGKGKGKGNISFHVSLSGTIFGDGKLCSITLFDLTSIKQAEAALIGNGRKFRLLFENMAEGFSLNEIITDEFGNPVDFRILEANSAYSQNSGLNPDKIIGKTILEIEPEFDLRQIETYGKVAMTGKPVYIEYFSKALNRSFSVRAFCPEHGKFATVFEDISSRKEAEEVIRLKNEELNRISAEKDRFYSILAHDLRSPFNGLLGLTQVLADELPDMEIGEAHKIAIVLKDSALRVYNLLENLLEWSRNNLGLIPFNPANLQLLPIMFEMEKLVKESSNNKNITISFDISDTLTVFADENMLRTILRNLFSNAVKFTPHNGRINISAKTIENNCAEISISDSGIGMSQEILDNLFRLDVQTNRAGTDGEASSGFGLLLCNMLVIKHEGMLSVESSEGKGSKFSFNLPF